MKVQFSAPYTEERMRFSVARRNYRDSRKLEVTLEAGAAIGISGKECISLKSITLYKFVTNEFTLSNCFPSVIHYSVLF